jgi:RND family efflux transporter MFP subunit
MQKDLSRLSIEPEHRRPRGRGRQLAALLALAVIAIVVTVVFVLREQHTIAVRTVVVRAAGSERATVLNASGYVTPRRRATVAAKVTGKIAEVFVDEGMQVDAGQVLARLDEVDALAQLHSAEAEEAVARAAVDDLEVRLENARRTLERTVDLRDSALVSEESLDDAETAVASLEAQIEVARKQIVAAARQVDIARQNVENCVVRAPFSGVVVSKDAQPGEMVSPISAGGGYTRTGIATIVDMQSLEIEVDVNEAYIARVAPGQRVEAVLDAYPDWRIPASVRTVIPTADREKATVKVRIAFDALDPRVLPDMGVKVSFLENAASETKQAALLVPHDAVFAANGNQYVQVVTDGRVEWRAVRTGRIRGGDVEIDAGLRSGEQVLAVASRELADGARVAVENP